MKIQEIHCRNTNLDLTGCSPGWMWIRQKEGEAQQRPGCGWEAGRPKLGCRCRQRQSWTCPSGKTPGVDKKYEWNITVKVALSAYIYDLFQKRKSLGLPQPCWALIFLIYIQKAWLSNLNLSTGRLKNCLHFDSALWYANMYIFEIEEKKIMAACPVKRYTLYSFRKTVRCVLAVSYAARL